MKIIEMAKNSNRRLVAPLMGFPGTSLTNTTIKANLHNPDIQFKTVHALWSKFRPDAMFFFMDLTVEAQAIGLPVRFPENESPSVENHPLKSEADLQNFRVPNPEKGGRTPIFIDVMKWMQSLDCARGAYAIGPFTLAGLMMGAQSAAIATLKNRNYIKSVLEYTVNVVCEYVKALGRAGADMIAILEPTATILSPRAFEEFSGQYIKRIVGCTQKPIILHICGDTTHLVKKMCETGAQALSLDGPVNFPNIIKDVPQDIVLVGNIDPVRVMMNMKPDQVYSETSKLLESMKGHDNFILSTGCDLPPETPLPNIESFMKCGREFKGRD